MNGPLATAGSILIALKNIGIKVPTKAETSIDKTNADEMHNEKIIEKWIVLFLIRQIYPQINTNANSEI